MHGPCISTEKRRRSDQPLCIVREMSSRTGTSSGAGS
jgi:hypothetical protein